MAEFENHNRINELDNGLDKKQQSKKKYWDKKGVLLWRSLKVCVQLISMRL